MGKCYSYVVDEKVIVVQGRRAVVFFYLVLTMSIFDDFSGGDQLDSSSGGSLDGDGVLGSHILTNTC